MYYMTYVPHCYPNSVVFPPATMLSRFIRPTYYVPVQRARFIHSSAVFLNEKKTVKHSSESYNKDVDPTPPADSSIHRVDPSSENVQKPHEAPSGEWSRAGIRTDEYRHVSKDQPYSAPHQDRRYGGKQGWAAEKGPETSHSGQGPEGSESQGRKPEGR